MPQKMLAFSMIVTCALGAAGCAVSADSDTDDTASAAQALTSGAQLPTVDDARDWMRWAHGQPWANGPVNDTTGAACGAGQSGSRWFLAGTMGGTVTRSCTIPANQTLVVPLINRWAFFRPELFPDADAIAKVQNQVDNYFKQQLARTCGLTIRVDGVDVAGSFEEMLDALYVEEKSTFIVSMVPGDNIFTPSGSPTGVDGGPVPAVAAGHYVEILPLAPGDHVLELGGKVCQNKNQVTFETAVTYHLHVDG